MAAVGVPDRAEQEAFMDLGLEIRGLQQLVENCQWCWQHGYEERLPELTETARRKVESVVRLGRRLHSFRNGEPVPDIIDQVLADANATLQAFVYWSMPVRVLH